MISDEDGTIVFTEKDGETFVRATDPSGKLIFEGPVNTKKERNSLQKVFAKSWKNLIINLARFLRLDQIKQIQRMVSKIAHH